MSERALVLPCCRVRKLLVHLFTSFMHSLLFRHATRQSIQPPLLHTAPHRTAPNHAKSHRPQVPRTPIDHGASTALLASSAKSLGGCIASSARPGRSTTARTARGSAAAALSAGARRTRRGRRPTATRARPARTPMLPVCPRAWAVVWASFRRPPESVIATSAPRGPLQPGEVQKVASCALQERTAARRDCPDALAANTVGFV